VASVLRDPGRRATLSALAREDAQRWSARQLAERLLRFYEKVIEADDVELSQRAASAARDEVTT